MNSDSMRPGRGEELSIRGRTPEVDGPEYGTGTRLGEHLGGRREDRVERRDHDRHLGASGTQPEDAVTVVHGMGRSDGSRQPVVCHIGQLGAPGLVEGRVGRHDTDGGVQGRARTGSCGQNASEFPSSSKGRLGDLPTADVPGQPGFRIDHRPDGVDDREGGHDVAFGGSFARRAHTALKAAGARTSSGPDRTDAEGNPSVATCSVAERCIGSVAPSPCSAEIEDHSRRNDRNHPIRWATQRKAAPHFVKTCHHAAGGIEPECTSTGQANGIHVANEGIGSEEVGFARSWCGTSDRHATGRRRWSDDDSGSGPPMGRHTLVVSHRDPLDVSETPERMRFSLHEPILSVDSTPMVIANLAA